MAGLTQVTERNFEAEVLRSEVPVLIEFGATWCGPCKTVAPELEAVASELRGKVKVVTVDVDQAPMLSREFGVQSVPAFVVFAEGRPVDGRVGAMNRKQIKQMLEPVLPRSAGALNPEELQQLQSRGAVSLVDTREAVVFNRARIEGAVNIPLEEIEGRLEELAALPSTPVLYCRTGEQTKEIAQKLAAKGAPVSYLEGGVLNWEASGFELVR